ncbi:uncharacterized protein LOC110660593 [Hevea brasiliensis]|uniref:uncharacterized protein LOC110660593 n=1 Tax=Hevea brasiliensis TaxID=3981 RepID=UPI0025E57CDA|nr:uncharacterized protein LOC110660593 [Hevea brasiliensis]
MGLRKLVPLRLVWVFAFVVCVLAPTIESQIQGCSIQGFDMGLCLNQRNRSFSNDSTCCKVLNKAAQTGYNCLCLLVASSLPLLSSPVSLPLSNCSISVPPLTLCKVLAPLPIVFPPNGPNEPTQPSLPPNGVPVSLPYGIQVPLKSTGNNNFAATQPSSAIADVLVSPPQEIPASSNTASAAIQPHSTSSENASPKSTLYKENETSKGRDKAKIMSSYRGAPFSKFAS